MFINSSFTIKYVKADEEDTSGINETSIIDTIVDDTNIDDDLINKMFTI